MNFVRMTWREQAVEVREVGSGPTIVLVHGYPLDGAMWSSVARRLSSKFRVLKPDLPGRADNPVEPDGSIDSYADFLRATIEGAGGSVGLAGFSMGGYVCLALMKRHPANVRALALVDTRAGADDEATQQARNEAIATLRQSGTAPIADAMLKKLLAPESLTRGDLADRVRRIILRQRPAAVESDLKAMRERPESTTFLPEISIPTLVLAGEQDAISPPSEGEAMAKAIPGGRFVVIPAAGHLTPMESPGGTARALEDFFAEALGREDVGGRT